MDHYCSRSLMIRTGILLDGRRTHLHVFEGGTVTAELIAISGVLDLALNSYKDSISILTDSRSSIQYLKNWPKIMDSTGLDILSKNEAADELAGRGCDLPNPSSTVLTHTEIPSFQRNKTNFTWRNPPANHWYAAKSPDLSIQCRSSRAHQTALARLRSGHLL
ncbi:RNase H domain-containing protein [Trichonephila clavipes]|uniref:RNase H domain-containing protein n=1 Tax=Trichonephila clavipes TaxID=2585209 RepID=A0A8X6VBC3_TRICX|nr:RNase H domain-containing protein [Trichonephila clavipes]